MPLDELDYVKFAMEFGFTPDQVDAIPLDLYPWMLPIAGAIHEAADAKARRDAGR